MKSVKVVFIAFYYFLLQIIYLHKLPDSIYVKNIKTVRLYNSGNQLKHSGNKIKQQ